MSAVDTDFILYDTREAARRLAGISPAKLLKLVHEGEIGHMNLGTADRPTYGFTPQHLHTYVKAREVTARGT